MKEETIKDFKVISNSNSTIFEEEVKEFLIKHPNVISSTSGVTESGSWCHIWYESKNLVAEDIRDEYVLRGEEYYCGNCPMWGGNINNGSPMCSSKVRYKDTRFCSKACLHFYQRLAEGEIRPVDCPSLDTLAIERQMFKELTRNEAR